MLLKGVNIRSVLRKLVAKVRSVLCYIRQREGEKACTHDALLRGRVARERVAHGAEHERGNHAE